MRTPIFSLSGMCWYQACCSCPHQSPRCRISSSEAMGFIIEKAFQHGGDFLRKEGIRYEALATVESLDDCKIVLK